jgi:putative ABC transport system permease protein
MLMLWNTFILALREIKRHVMRSLLTVLGIVIGVASVITMVTLGNGATVQVTEQIASLGSNLVMISPGKRMGPGQDSTAPPFKLADADAIAKNISSIAAVAPSSSRSATAIFGNENWSTTIHGTNNQYMKVRNWAVETGREFTDGELRAGNAVCIIGHTVTQKLFGEQMPLGKRIRLGKLSFLVIGLLETKGQSTMGMDQDDVVLIPVHAFHRRIAGNKDISLIQVSVRDGVSTEKAQEEIESLLRERRHITAGEEDNFHVMDMKEIAKMLTGTTQVLTALLSAVAAVSLLVGGIGIMNIMLVSVTERTREIGIRLAIGALEREVLLQFLVEAVTLSSSGGLFGIALGLAACAALKNILQVPFVFSPGIVILAFVFSASVGVIFGYFPALKAASLDPIEALRHE